MVKGTQSRKEMMISGFRQSASRESEAIKVNFFCLVSFNAWRGELAPLSVVRLVRDTRAY